MKSIAYSEVRIGNGYIGTRQMINRTATLPAVYERFSAAHRFEALKCRWKNGDPDMPHIFWDSDVAKWLEGASYILKFSNDDEIRAEIESAIDDIIENSDDDGVF